MGDHAENQNQKPEVQSVASSNRLLRETDSQDQPENLKRSNVSADKIFNNGPDKGVELQPDWQKSPNDKQHLPVVPTGQDRKGVSHSLWERQGQLVQGQKEFPAAKPSGAEVTPGTRMAVPAKETGIKQAQTTRQSDAEPEKAQTNEQHGTNRRDLPPKPPEIKATSAGFQTSPQQSLAIQSDQQSGARKATEAPRGDASRKADSQPERTALHTDEAKRAEQIKGAELTPAGQAQVSKPAAENQRSVVDRLVQTDQGKTPVLEDRSKTTAPRDRVKTQVPEPKEYPNVQGEHRAAQNQHDYLAPQKGPVARKDEPGGVTIDRSTAGLQEPSAVRETQFFEVARRRILSKLLMPQTPI